MKQLALKFYEKHKINRRAKPGDIVIREGYKFGKNKTCKKVLIPSLVIKGERNISYNWISKLKGVCPITTAYLFNMRIRSFNWYLDYNEIPKYKPEFLDRAHGKKVEIGQMLIKIERVRTTYRVTKVEYDGVMNKGGFFILPKQYDNESDL